ncbi:centractin- actin- protein of the dynactin complex [Purpureocillium takamizusanense]|uniref:Centractin- actin- protein of the dynactin complex n=1 Tax=Purpureocillium takamizusanense TaxID=2060973 RepID=A0A9Q8QBP7_9HYPO|nr:centractin- actin- protein of the dynactin complex [Purpureocillium takamizusanense]UNI16079.1 centractin- actin- protein of the dynactin complex [Purpureocillium takamizusanense]
MATQKVVVLLLVTLVAGVFGALEHTGTSVKLNDVYYFVSPFSQGQPWGRGGVEWKSHSKAPGLIPVTVVAQPCPEDSLHSLFTNWTSRDDVWQPGFLETVLLAGFDTTKSKGADAATRRSYWADTLSTVLPLQSAGIPSGPYFLDTSTGQVYQAYRLYEDFAGAFTQSLLQGPDGRFQTLSAQVPASASVTMGVPSRLYFTPSKRKPLAGVRIGVKDIFALAGVKQSNGNRAWYGLYPPASATGTAMRNLIAAGAVIVGLQKTSQFANGELATADWVDYHAPFNPRGDGYQDGAASSAGAGASVASYPWLDLALGSDTGGSVRGPAAVEGLFGNRPSHGLVGLDHVMPLSPALDTPGFLARDPRVWDAACAALYLDNYTSFAGDEGSATPKYPKTLYVLDLATTTTTTATKKDDDDPATLMRKKFASDLALFLNTSATTLDLEREWATSGPAEGKGQNISQLLHLTYAAFITKDQTKLLRDPFYKDYAAAHDGRRPFVDPAPLVRWAWADSQPDSVRDDALANKTLFMNWFNDKILPPASPHDPLACSSGFLLHADSTGFFSSRNRYLDPPAPPLGFSNGEISVFAETPDSVFPLGQVPVFSSVTNHTEFLPVTIDVMAAKGCDGLIARLARDLVAAGILTAPKVGPGLDGEGAILLRRDVRY